MQSKNEIIKDALKFSSKKADDEGRRTFIRQLGVVLATAGVGTTTKLEFMESLSKRLFGSALAFADTSSTPAFYLEIAGRFGDPYVEYALPSPHLTTRLFSGFNFHAGPQAIQTIETGRGAKLHLAPQAAAFANIKNNVAKISGYPSVIGHSNTFATTVYRGEHIAPKIAKQRQEQRKALLPGGIVFGPNLVTITSADAFDYQAFYLDRPYDFVNLLEPYQIRLPNNQFIPNQLSVNVIRSFGEGVWSKIEKLLKGVGKGTDLLVKATDAQVVSIINSNLVAKLGPDAELMARIRGNAVQPEGGIKANQFATSAPLDELLAFAIKVREYEVLNYMAIVNTTEDWHATLVSPLSNDDKGETGVNAVAANGVRCIATFLTNFWKELGTKSIEGKDLTQSTVVNYTSEFFRTAESGLGRPGASGGDNGDGGHMGCMLIAHESKLNSGCYHSYNPDKQEHMSYDGSNYVDGLRPYEECAGTLMKLTGVKVENPLPVSPGVLKT